MYRLYSLLCSWEWYSPRDCFCFFPTVAAGAMLAVLPQVQHLAKAVASPVLRLLVTTGVVGGFARSVLARLDKHVKCDLCPHLKWMVFWADLPRQRAVCRCREWKDRKSSSQIIKCCAPGCCLFFVLFFLRNILNDISEERNCNLLKSQIQVIWKYSQLRFHSKPGRKYGIRDTNCFGEEANGFWSPNHE